MKNLIRKLIQYHRIKYRCPKDGMEVEVEARGQPAPKCPLAAPQCNMSGQSNDSADHIDAVIRVYDDACNVIETHEHDS